MIGVAFLAWGVATGSAALLALFLARGRLALRLYVDALAVGMTLGATMAVALAPFDLRANPLHLSAHTLAFLFAGLPEEGVKMLGAAAFLRGHYLARGRRDVVFAAGAMALGFAGLENVFYLANAGAGWAALAFERALTAMPFHVFTGLASGYVVARATPGPRGLALGVAAWLGLAAVHGAYDFAVFGGVDGATAPDFWRRAVAALGGDAAGVLRALLAGAEAAAAVAGVAAATAFPPAAPSRGCIGSRGLAWLVGGPLAVGAGVALAMGAASAVALASADAFFRAAILSIAPLALGAAFIFGPAPPASRGARRALTAAGLVAALSLSVAVATWGPAQWRTLTALRFETSGDRAFARGDYAAAVEDYGRTLAVDPRRVVALSRRAAAEAALTRYEAAGADLDAALRLAPETITLLVQRADLARSRNLPTAAVADLDATLKLKPGDAQLLALRAGARLEAGNRAGAGDDLDLARAAAPGDGAVRRARAAYALDGGDLDGAIGELNAQLHADPNDVTAVFQRGRAWLYKGEFARARADFARADKPGFLYPALWRFLADRRLKRGGEAELLQKLSSAPGAWPAPVARMLARLASYEDVRRAAKDEGERCEVDFYDTMARPAPDASRLDAAAKACPPGFIEHEGAKAELRRLAP